MSKGNQGQISMWLATRGGAILLFAVLAASVMPQGHAAQTSSGAGRPVPTTLAEAHAELARTLSAKVLKQIDAMKSEAEMGEFHFSLGLNIRNGWGLWRDSPLQQYMRGAGFTHPDDMSSVILATFWCARHGKPLRLEERAAEYAAHWEEARRLQQAEDNRVTSAKQKMQSMMMGLNLNTSGAVSIRMPDVGVDSIRARFLAPYRGGVLLAVRRTTGQKDDDFIMEPYFLSPADKSIHRVTVPELQKIHSVVAAAETVWIAGVANGAHSILELSASGRRLLKIPSEAVPPQLGLQGDALLAVYPHRVYKLVDSAWSTLYQGDIPIPRSGPPPQLIGDRLFLRDEGHRENDKRLWWLTLGTAAQIVSLDGDTGVVGRDGPRWENSLSYAVSRSGDLWASVGEGSAPQSLLRKRSDGTYSIAIMNNSLRFTPDLFNWAERNAGINVSSIAVLDDDSILLVGKSGLYHLKEGELMQELKFTNYVGTAANQWNWNPGNVLVRGRDSYLISGTFGGVYLLEKENEGIWVVDLLDDKLGKPIRW